MRTYAAISLLTVADARTFNAAGYPYVLASFHYHSDRSDEALSRLDYTPAAVLGDSGAFTVWTRGATVDLDAYTAWCLDRQQRHPEYLAINLDVIPGTAEGGRPSRREQRRAQDESVANGDALRAAGVRLMEVFHLHEPLSYLDVLLERRRRGEVLALGGLAGRGAFGVKRVFCDRVFAHVLARDGLPPLHGLGISHDSRLSSRYPWFSLDASSWSTAVRYGEGVRPGGRRTHRSDPRTSSPRLRQLYISRVLNGWAKGDRELTALWAARGVEYAP